MCKPPYTFRLKSDRFRLHENRRLTDLKVEIMRNEIINTSTAVSPTSHHNTGVNNRISRGGRIRAIPVVLHHRISRTTAERITNNVFSFAVMLVENRQLSFCARRGTNST